MSTVTVTTANGKVVVSSPFHREFPPRARAIGGDFARDGSKTWIFDTRDETRVRELLTEFFGTDGSPDADLVTVHVNLAHHGRHQEIWFAGRKIAERRNRDEPVRLGEGVVIVESEFPSSGGSVAYPTLGAKGNAAAYLQTMPVVEIRDLPRAAVEAEDVKYTIVAEAPAEVVDAAKLRAEREQLLARLAEIDALLERDENDKDQDGGNGATATEAPPAEVAAPASTTEYGATVERSARTVRRWIAAGKLAARKIGGTWIILPTPTAA